MDSPAPVSKRRNDTSEAYNTQCVVKRTWVVRCGEMIESHKRRMWWLHEWGGGENTGLNPDTLKEIDLCS